MNNDIVAKIKQAVNRDRLLKTAVQLVEIPSPTRSAANVSNRLAEILRDDGFDVQRPVANWSDAPAVAVRYDSGQPGRTLQFNGHLHGGAIRLLEPDLKIEQIEVELKSSSPPYSLNTNRSRLSEVSCSLPLTTTSGLSTPINSSGAQGKMNA